MTGYLLDTHIWYWYLEGSRKLPVAVKRLLDETHKRKLFLSPISILELGMLHRKGQIVLKEGYEKWLSNAATKVPLIEVAIDRDIATRAYYLPLLHNDPADRLIAATAVEHNLTLVTIDRRLIGNEWLKTFF